MLAPEVWSFPPPAYSISNNICRTKEDILKLLKNQYFNHHVSITLPNTLQAPNDLINVLVEDSQFYRINNLPVVEFVEKQFVDLFVTKGQLTAISIGITEQDDLFAFIPSGKLILSLSKKTYQGLGIEGNFIKQCKNSFRKYSIVLDLGSGFNESGKGWKQIHHKLKACAHLKFDVVLTWEPNDISICPSSIALYFSNKRYNLKTCNVQFKQRTAYNVSVPLYDDESDVGDLVEWLGAFSLQCDMCADSYISTMKCPDRNENYGQVVHLTFTGLFTLSRIQKIISEIWYMTAKSHSTWIGLFIKTFDGSAISVKNKNLFRCEGDQHHTVFFKMNHPSLLCSFQDKILPLKGKKKHRQLQYARIIKSDIQLRLSDYVTRLKLGLFL